MQGPLSAPWPESIRLSARRAERILARGSVAAWPARAAARSTTAIESFEQALKHDPGSVEALLGRGNALYALERYGEALAAYDRALETAPDLPGSPPRPFERALGSRPCG